MVLLQLLLMLLLLVFFFHTLQQVTTLQHKEHVDKGFQWANVGVLHDRGRGGEAFDQLDAGGLLLLLLNRFFLQRKTHAVRLAVLLSFKYKKSDWGRFNKLVHF